MRTYFLLFCTYIHTFVRCVGPWVCEDFIILSTSFFMILFTRFFRSYLAKFYDPVYNIEDCFRCLFIRSVQHEWKRKALEDFVNGIIIITFPFFHRPSPRKYPRQKEKMKDVRTCVGASCVYADFIIHTLENVFTSSITKKKTHTSI